MKEQSELDTTKNDSVNAHETEILEVSHEAYCKKSHLSYLKLMQTYMAEIYQQ